VTAFPDAQPRSSLLLPARAPRPRRGVRGDAVRPRGRVPDRRCRAPAVRLPSPRTPARGAAKSGPATSSAPPTTSTAASTMIPATDAGTATSTGVSSASRNASTTQATNWSAPAMAATKPLQSIASWNAPTTRTGNSRTPATPASTRSAPLPALTTREGKPLRAIDYVLSLSLMGTCNSCFAGSPNSYARHFSFSLSESFSASCALMRKNVGMKRLWPMSRSSLAVTACSRFPATHVHWTGT
jgi:hypothetical protein